jgi:glycosyltransferase involved in cell wall biosynthesis
MRILSRRFVQASHNAAPHVAFLYMKGRLARLAEVESGAAPTEFFYGAIEMSRSGFKVQHYEIDPGRPATLGDRILGRLWPRGTRPVKVEPSIVTQAYGLAGQLNAADCLVATGGNIAYALAALARVRVIRKPIVGIQCGVLNFKHSYLRREISAALLRRMDTLLFGEAELRPMCEYFHLPEDAISVNLFGVDANFWRPDPAVARDIVLSIGNDGRRDYQTLVEAAAQIPAPVHIITKLPLPGVMPPNVVHHLGSWHGTELSDERVREWYQRARAVVVPLQASTQPSGQSVTLQAMACGAPVVLTETQGLWSREQMVEGRNVLFVRPGDSVQLAARVRELIGNDQAIDRLGRAGRETVERTGTIGLFAERVALRCEHAIGRSGNSRRTN